ncbi:PIN domain-like protein [Fimicolochytrium jonesii]|uniref:PIN domain-like protein n=1 Tax=Fimicolochytrium jonesii TaxID=1396493 RepID=UPI0022FEF19F|nr:PIN domain-like protein [Fimicolochytrium jonesii]KAI8818775.1 PIN domain-like protein [Fimicolochytrium jonesii]
MGISGLTKVIGDHAPTAIRENEIKNYFGRKVAIDASMSIYQFLIAVRQQDGMQLTNEAGETTSHLMGIFYRTIRMVENGIKPVYVFDGKPPDLKADELKKRLEKRTEAEAKAEAATEAGDTENFDKFSRRTVKVTKEHNNECKKLLRLMGIPYIEAPCEAESQCAALAAAGKVFAAGSEDMDTLTFGSPILLRHLTFSEQRKMPIAEIHLDKALEGLQMTMDQFIDLCILLGCDYCDSIRGIGPHRAVALMKECGSLEAVLQKLDPKKYPIPEDWPYQRARELFKKPDVIDPATIDLKWEVPDEQAIVDFMVTEKNFSEERVRTAVQKLTRLMKQETQGRLDNFFKVLPKDPSTNSSLGKRKADEKKGPAAKKGAAAAGKKKTAGGGGGKPRR